MHSLILAISLLGMQYEQGAAAQVQRAEAEEHVRRGLDDSASGRLDQAIAAFSEALRIDPKCMLAYYNRGRVYALKESYQKAITDFGEAIRLDPGNLLAWQSRGWCYLLIGEHKKAIADCSELLRLDPRSVKGYVIRAAAYGKFGETEKAIADANAALKLEPNSAPALGCRGCGYLAKGDYDRAIADCNEAVEIDPKYAAPYGTRGMAYFYKGEDEKAEADLIQAIRMDSKFVDPYCGLALIRSASSHEKSRDGKKAVEYATKACELSQWKDPTALAALAAAQAECGRFTEAVKWAKQALKLAPESLRGDYSALLEACQMHQPYRIH